MSKNAIEVRNLTKKYEGFKLDNICFEIPEGSIVGFIGENGAGKSTTMKAMLGLIPVEEGEIKLLDHSVDRDLSDGKWKEQVSVVFDECNFPNELKLKNVNHFMKYIYQTWDEKLFKEYLQKFELPENKKVRELSKGMKMKLSIAAAFSHESRLMILDEATSGLDPVVRNEILDLFREYVEDENRTVFLSSHIISDIEKAADYIILIHKGKVLLMESKDQLLYEYGMVKCSRGQADEIPAEIIVGREDNSFGTSVLIRNRQGLLEQGFFDRHAKEIQPPVMDRVGIEDILLYAVKYYKES